MMKDQDYQDLMKENEILMNDKYGLGLEDD
jgi:hypothetical protein